MHNPDGRKGVYIGMKMNTGAKLIAATEGVCKARSIRRRPENERWDTDGIMKVFGSPRKP